MLYVKLDDVQVIRIAWTTNRDSIKDFNEMELKDIFTCIIYKKCMLFRCRLKVIIVVLFSSLFVGCM